MADIFESEKRSALVSPLRSTGNRAPEMRLIEILRAAPFIGFNGTPIQKTDANTRIIFGDSISIHDIQHAASESHHSRRG